MMTLSKVCNGCKQKKPIKDFYLRQNGTPTSECKDCMKARRRSQQHLPPEVPRASTELLAINYLTSKGIHALPGKAVKNSWCDVVAWGAIGIEVKYGLIKWSGTRYENNYVMTPAQQQRGLIGHLVMLIYRADKDAAPSFHIFKKDDPVFYIWRDGEPCERLKSGLTYFRGRTKALKHGDNRVVMTDAMMDAARDNTALIWSTMAAISTQLASRISP